MWFACELPCPAFLQLELLPEDVVQPTSREGGNFPHESEYVPLEGRERGPEGSILLPGE